MKLTQPYTPDYTYCIVCGNKTNKQTCDKVCYWKLEEVRSAIMSQKYCEKINHVKYDQKTIKIFNDLHRLIG